VDPQLRRQSSLLARSLLVLTLLFVGVDTALAISTPGYRPPWAGYAILVATFALNRAGYFRQASLVTSVLFSSVAFALVYSGAVVSPSLTLGYLALGPMLGTFLLPIRGVVAITAFNLLGIVLAYFVAPGLRGQLAPLIGPFSTNAMLGVLAAFYMHYRNRVESDRTEALRNSEERLRLALSAAELGTWEIHAQGRAVSLDARARAILAGEARSEQALVEAFCERDRPQLAEAVSAVLAGDASSFALTLARASDPECQVEVIGRAVTASDASGLRLIGTLLDVSARKKLEDQLRQGQKMEALGRLGGGIAHDFNNVLTVILGNTALLRRKLPAVEELEHIEAAASSAAVLTRQLLAFGRSAVLEPKVLDLAGVVRGSASMVSRLIGEDVAISCHADDAVWPTKLDQSLIEQVLLNLATNARDAMPGGGMLEISVDNQVLRPADPRLKAGREPGDYVRLCVSDAGQGMDASTSSRIFEPFFTTKPRGKGTGLGLAMVFGTVSQSGGFIEVTSELGKGTRLELYFPRSRTEARAATQVAQVPATGHETLLLVEDDESVRRVIEHVLRDAGYRVLSANSPRQARERWAAFGAEVALVITDEVMPGGRGTDLIAELRKQRPQLRALSMSGYAEPEGASAASALELKRIQKPFALDDLLSQVRSLLDGS
jgi:signal transduction histidine kinase/CheY-like chemotaxis protein